MESAFEIGLYGDYCCVMCCSNNLSMSEDGVFDGVDDVADIVIGDVRTGREADADFEK